MPGSIDASSISSGISALSVPTPAYKKRERRRLKSNTFTVRRVAFWMNLSFLVVFILPLYDFSQGEKLIDCVSYIGLRQLYCLTAVIFASRQVILLTLFAVADIFSTATLPRRISSRLWFHPRSGFNPSRTDLIATWQAKVARLRCARLTHPTEIWRE